VRVALYYTFYWGVVGVYYPFLAVYLADLGLSGTEIGVLYALLPLMALVAAPFVSLLADRRGWRVRLLMGALLALVPVALALALPRTFWGILPLLALLALLRAVAEPLADSLAVRMAACYRLRYGTLRLWGSLSFAATALLFGGLWERVGFAFMFPATGLLILLVAFSAVGLEESRTEACTPRRPFWEVSRDRGLVALFIASALVGASLGVFNTFSGVYLADLGAGEFLVGALFALSALCELPTMRLADRMLGTRPTELGPFGLGPGPTRRAGLVPVIGDRPGPAALLLSYGLLTLAYFGYGLTASPTFLLLFGALKGLGFGLFFVGTVRLVDARTPLEWSSTFQSLIMGAAAFGLGQLVASPLGGLLYDLVSPGSVFLACALLSVAAGLTLLGARDAFGARGAVF